MRGIVSLFVIGAALLSGSVHGKVPENLLPTEKEKTAFLDEADDFLDALPDGYQDRQGDAVLHALRGQTAELQNVRMSRNAASLSSDKVETEDLLGTGAARGIKMRLYRNKGKDGEKLPLLIYLHGGGWTFGSIHSCGSFCMRLAETGDVNVLAVDYRLAPENPYPSGLMDCVSAVEYAFAHAEEWGCSPQRISIGGDSSGGNLALATAMYMEDSELKDKIRSLVLFYPVLKSYPDKSASWKRYSRGYGLDSRLMESFIEAYLNAPADGGSSVKSDAKEAMVSPAEASDEQISKLPPILIVGAERDILYDQGKEFAARLKGKGNDAEHITFPGAVHLFITVEGQPTAFNKSISITSAYLSE